MVRDMVKIHVTEYVFSIKLWKLCIAYYIDPHLFCVWIHRIDGVMKEFKGWVKKWK